MARTKISEFSATPGNNTDIDGINIAEGCAPSGINDAIRELMSQLKDFQAGTAGDSFNGPVGTTTAAAGAFTTLSASGNITVSGGTANGVAYLNGSKVLTTGSALSFDGSQFAVNVSSSGIPLVVNGTGNTGLRVIGGTGAGLGSYLSLQAQGGNAALIGTEAAIVGSGTSTNLMLYGYGSNSIIFAPATAEGMRLTTIGLGIGTSSPAKKLQVQQTAVGEVARLVTTAGGAGATIGTVSLGFDVFGSQTNPFASIEVGEDESVAAGTYKSRMSFYTRSVDSDSAPAERMRLDSSGNLGLGVTPSAWGSSNALQIGSWASLSSANAYGTGIGFNNFYNGTNHIYSFSNAATKLELGAGVFKFFTATSGTAGNAISFTQAMTLDASGNLGIGITSPTRLLHLGGGAGVTVLQMSNNASGNTVNDGLQIIQYGVDSSIVNKEAGYLSFETSNTERARITSGGDLLVGSTSAIAGERLYVNGSNANYINRIYNSNASPNGVIVSYTGAAPNGTANEFLRCDDTAAARMSVRSNGGIANYQSNNVDLSDARTKKEITPAPSYWDKIGALEIVTYKYNDQTHDDVNVGVIAQQVESVEPVWVDADGFGESPEDGVPLKTVYTKDITFAAIKALQEAMARIEQLEAKVAALEAK